MQTKKLKGGVMSKGYAFDDNIQKYYIVTQPTRLSDLQLEELDGEPTARAIKRGRKLRDRREARIKNQLA
jgi:hypothetical protein